MREDAIVPMCQSPKIANVQVHARGLPANDNCPIAETCVKPFQATGPFAAVWQAFLGLLRQKRVTILNGLHLPTFRQ
jgi:hypothetical protein